MTKNDKKQKNSEKESEEIASDKKEKPDDAQKKDASKETKEAAKEAEKELTETEKLSMELLKSYEKIDELTDMLKRLQAEFENYRKRTEKDSKRALEYSGAAVIGKVLPIIDTFEIAIKNSDDPNKFKEGTEMIYRELMSTLKSEGLQKIDALGKKFDPYFHDAMMAVETKDEDKDKVIEVLQEGYKLKDKVLRHAKVKISK